MPVTFPVKSPVTLPVTSPVKSPVTLPVTLPVKSPVTLPVKLPTKSPPPPPPVTLPSMLQTKVGTVYPTPAVFTVVVGSSVKPAKNLNLPSEASLKTPVYLVVASCTYLPYKPMSIALAAFPDANFIKGSSTDIVDTSTCTVSPVTVKLPSILTSPAYKVPQRFSAVPKSAALFVCGLTDVIIKLL